MVNCNSNLVLPETYPDLKIKWVYNKIYEVIRNKNHFYSISLKENDEHIDYKIKLQGEIQNGNLVQVKVANF